MLGAELALEPPAPLAADSEGQIMGCVGFIGATTGMIYLYTTLRFARHITARMLGTLQQDSDGDAMVIDAVGELSNMVVGYVKSRLSDEGLSCTLTIPSVVRGKSLSVQRSSHVERSMLRFRDGEHFLVAEILLKKSDA